MKISLITVCFNAQNYISKCINSVALQDYGNVEYIVVDGGSTDNTLQILNQHQHLITKLVTEPDKGIYDAINKGIALSTGDVVGVLHADDFFAANNILSKVAEVFLTQNADLLYGNLDYVNRTYTHKITRKWRSNAYHDNLFLKGWMPAHPTFYAKKSCFLALGNYDLNFKSAADYDLMLRFFYKTPLKKVFLNIVMVKMRIGGKSNVNFANRWKANREDYLSLVKNKIPFAFVVSFLKPISKLFQFLK